MDTYVPTWAGFLYLAVVLDAFSRRIVGWSMATSLATQLVLDALNMALEQRRPKEVIHHSDSKNAMASRSWAALQQSTRELIHPIDRDCDRAARIAGLLHLLVVLADQTASA